MYEDRRDSLWLFRCSFLAGGMPPSTVFFANAGNRPMPIRPYLAGRTFAPETIAVMSAALEEACASLNIGADNPSRAMVAQTIIGLVEEGQTDADRLAAVAITEMHGPKSTQS